MKPSCTIHLGLNVPSRRVTRPRLQSGLTLLEMLVTLVLFGLISLLLWQALAQLAVLEARLSDPRVLNDGPALQRAWVYHALAGTATSATGDAQRFSGRADRIDTWTTQAPWPSAAGLERMTLRLVTRGEGAERTTEVQAARALAVALSPLGADDLVSLPLDAGTPGQAAVLWRWEGEGRFEFLDAARQWVSTWPPAGARSGDLATALPRAIRLLGAPGGPLLAPVVATQSPMVRRADLPVLNDDTPR